jgi:hypothetical protein
MLTMCVCVCVCVCVLGGGKDVCVGVGVRVCVCVCVCESSMPDASVPAVIKVVWLGPISNQATPAATKVHIYSSGPNVGDVACKL